MSVGPRRSKKSICGARVQGFLGPRLFKEGDDVKEGQVVFTIEREPFEAVVDQRKAQLAAARATLANADQRLQRTSELARKSNVPIAQLDRCRYSSR
jgi:membrane fusion protein (multidrug efflux system)